MSVDKSQSGAVTIGVACGWAMGRDTGVWRLGVLLGAVGSVTGAAALLTGAAYQGATAADRSLMIANIPPILLFRAWQQSPAALALCQLSSAGCYRGGQSSRSSTGSKQSAAS